MAPLKNPRQSPKDVDRTTDKDVQSLADKLQGLPELQDLQKALDDGKEFVELATAYEEAELMAAVALQHIRGKMSFHEGTIKTIDPGEKGKLRIRKSGGEIKYKEEPGTRIQFTGRVHISADTSGQDGKFTPHIWLELGNVVDGNGETINQNYNGKYASAEYIVTEDGQKVFDDKTIERIKKKFNTLKDPKKKKRGAEKKRTDKETGGENSTDDNYEKIQNLRKKIVEELTEKNQGTPPTEDEVGEELARRLKEEKQNQENNPDQNGGGKKRKKGKKGGENEGGSREDDGSSPDESRESNPDEKGEGTKEALQKALNQQEFDRAFASVVEIWIENVIEVTEDGIFWDPQANIDEGLTSDKGEKRNEVSKNLREATRLFLLWETGNNEEKKKLVPSILSIMRETESIKGVFGKEDMDMLTTKLLTENPDYNDLHIRSLDTLRSDDSLIFATGDSEKVLYRIMDHILDPKHYTKLTTSSENGINLRTTLSEIDRVATTIGNNLRNPENGDIYTELKKYGISRAKYNEIKQEYKAEIEAIIDQMTPTPAESKDQQASPTHRELVLNMKQNDLREILFQALKRVVQRHMLVETLKDYGAKGVSSLSDPYIKMFTEVTGISQEGLWNPLNIADTKTDFDSTHELETIQHLASTATTLDALLHNGDPQKSYDRISMMTPSIHDYEENLKKEINTLSKKIGPRIQELENFIQTNTPGGYHDKADRSKYPDLDDLEYLEQLNETARTISRLK